MKLSSSAFKINTLIPAEYTCDGDDVNPPLIIEGVPSKAKSLALIADDPDAPHGTWVHWVMWNIDPKTSAIKSDSVPAGARQGVTDFKKNEYGGPCPPSGSHRYFFKLYALDTMLDLASNTTSKALSDAMQGHIVEQAELIGLYKRK